MLKIKKPFMIVALILFLSSISLAAEEADILDLETAIRISLQNNQTILKGAQDSLNIALLTRVITYKAYKPRLGLGVDAKHNRSELEDFIDSSATINKQDTYSTGLTFMWPFSTITGGTFTTQSGYGINQVFDSEQNTYASNINFGLGYRQPLSHGGRLKERFSLFSADQVYEKSKIEYNINIDKLLMGVIDSYYNLLKSKLNIAQAQERLALTRKLLNWTEAKFKAGEIAELDVLYVKVELASAEVALLELEETDKNTKRAFLRLLGLKDKNQEINLDDAVEIASLSFTEEESVKRALETNYAIKQMRIDLKTNYQEISIADSNNKPVLNLATDYTLTNTSSELSETIKRYPQKNWSVSANIAFPFFDSKTTSNENKKAELYYSKMKNDYNNLRDDFREQIKDLYNNLSQSRKRLDLLEANLNIAEKAYNTSELKYKIGLASIRDVLESQVAYTNMKIALKISKIDYLLNEIKIYQARGDLQDVFIK